MTSIVRKKQPLPEAPDLDEKLFLFIGGLHRSGTSILHRLLREHPDTSGFSSSGSREDEGQHLQSVFPTAAELGGPGRFAFDKDSHLSEHSELVSNANRQKIRREWGAYYDLDKKVLLEKSPPNIIRSRFLQAMFPHSVYVFVIRHPISVSISTQKWSKTSLIDLLQHWHKAHEILYRDLPHLDGRLVLRYEDLVDSPEISLSKICSMADIDTFTPQEHLVDHNAHYFSTWLSDHSDDKKIVINQYPELVDFAETLGYFFDEPFVR